MRKAFLLLMLVTGFILGACSTTVARAEQNYPIKIWAQNSNGKYETLCVVDEETGVNYIVISGELYQKGIGLGVTPRLKSDGSLYISEK